MPFDFVESTSMNFYSYYMLYLFDRDKSIIMWHTAYPTVVSQNDYVAFEKFVRFFFTSVITTKMNGRILMNTVSDNDFKC